MLRVTLITCLFSLVAVQCFKIVSRVEPSEGISPGVLSAKSRSIEIDSPYPDHATYEAVFAGIKKPVAVDCTQPGVICKFPLVIAGKDLDASKLGKVKEVPIIKGVESPSNGESEIEGREDLNEEIVKTGARVPIYKDTFDVESVAADEKDIEDTWILEKNTLNKKYQIPVKLIPSKPNRGQGIAPVYPVHHDFHDHFSGGNQYGFPDRHGHGWTPWIRSYPSVYNYPTNQPCNPPVYHHPPPCHPAVAPTKKPTINIDDKVDKGED